ncbi:MAG TPA: restriction endonuclease [Aurantimonas coralicida]|uniref:Restriction endonuclease n=1 Tax=Aurantimonas coralicida TaxID=182270 RepID=A0A9C9NF91_9HYPH|nr:restriction endonuclease [Aurantimonas coralicida]HEU00114.1 restriction endonuclease [Aurantimonas coralicida]
MGKPEKLKKIRTALAQEQNWLCHYCDSPMWDSDPAVFLRRHHVPKGLLNRFQCTAEHLRPKQDGGKDIPENIVAACKFCNQTRHKRRSAQPPETYRQHVQKRVKAGKWHPLKIHRLTITVG